MKNVYFITNNSEIGGANNALLRLINIMDSKYTKKVIFPESGSIVKRFSANNIKYEILNYNFGNIGHSTALNYNTLFSIPKLAKDIFNVIRATIKFIDYFKKNKIDIVHINTSVLVAPALAGKLLNIPVFWHIREHIIDDRLGKINVKVIQYLATKIISINKSTASVFTKEVNVLYDFVIDNSIPDIKEKYSRPYSEGQINISFFGGMSYLKGIRDYLLLVKLFRDRNMLNRYKFMIVGSMKKISIKSIYNKITKRKMVQYFKEVDSLLKELTGLIEIYGLVDDIAPVFKESDIVLILHTFQHSSLVAAEAGIMKKTVIAYSWPEIEEYISNTHSGYLVPKNDITSIYDLIVKLTNDKHLMSETSEKAYELTRKNFTDKILAKSISKIYE